MRDINDKVVLLTGASGGLGQALARALAREGCHLALAGWRNREKLETLASEIESSGRRASTFFYDITRDAGRQGLVEAVQSQFGVPDILVNNAGVSRWGSIARMDEAVVTRTFETNLLGPMLLTRLVLQGMIERGSGHILNVSSMSGKAGIAYLAAYSASKAGLTTWTYALRQELRGTGVSASVINPIFIAGEGMFAKGGFRAHFITREVSVEQFTRKAVRVLRRGTLDENLTAIPMRWMLAIREFIPESQEWFFNWIGLSRWLRMMGEAADRRRPGN